MGPYPGGRKQDRPRRTPPRARPLQDFSAPATPEQVDAGAKPELALAESVAAAGTSGCQSSAWARSHDRPQGRPLGNSARQQAVGTGQAPATPPKGQPVSNSCDAACPSDSPMAGGCPHMLTGTTSGRPCHSPPPAQQTPGCLDRDKPTPGRQKEARQSARCRESPPGRIPTLLRTRYSELLRRHPSGREKLGRRRGSCRTKRRRLVEMPKRPRSWWQQHRPPKGGGKRDRGGREAPLHPEQGTAAFPLASNSVAVWIALPLGHQLAHLTQQRLRLKATADLPIVAGGIMITATTAMYPTRIGLGEQIGQDPNRVTAPMQHTRPTVSRQQAGQGRA